MCYNLILFLFLDSTLCINLIQKMYLFSFLLPCYSPFVFFSFRSSISDVNLFTNVICLFVFPLCLIYSLPFFPHRVYPLLICSSLFRSCSLSGGLFVWPGLKVSKIVLIDTIFLVSVIHRCLLTSSFSLPFFSVVCIRF